MNKTMLNAICKLLALSYVDNFDIESEEITICGFSCYHGLALVATYYDSGVPNVHLVSFDVDSFDDLLESDCESDTLTVEMDEVPNPLVHSYDNALKLFLLAAGSDLHCITLLGCDDLGFNRFDVSKTLDTLYNS